MLRAIHLHGRLGKRFGRRFDLAVASPTEAIRALVFQLPGFGEYIRHRGYVVSIGEGTVLPAEAIDLQLGGQRDIHITPAGAAGGVVEVLLGATLLLAAVASVSVLAMPKAPTAASREEATKTASFVFDGAENVTEQGHPVPLVYGRFRTGSVVVSAGISTTDVNEASVSADPTNPGGGAVYDGYVGSTPGIRGSSAGDEWVSLQKGGGKGGSAGSTRAAQEDPNSLQSQATAKVLDLVSEGEIVGLFDGLRSIYFDDTPLQNADGSFNFAGVAVERRVGLPDQDFIPGFSQTENSFEVNTEVRVLTGPVTRSISNPNATVARVTISLPQLQMQDTTNGDLKASSVEIKISVQSDGGGFTDVVSKTFTGRTNSGYQWSTDIRLPNGNQRDIRVTRMTPDSQSSTLANETHWDLLTEVIEAKLSYPDTALIGLTVDARQFGSSIPARSYDLLGLIVEVPSNYDPVARTYGAVWDGTFKRAWTDNPAWVFRDIVVARRYGLGSRVPPESVDKWGLYAIAQHCDGMVPDGRGGMQPRYTINCVINNPAAAYDVLASIASNFRGFAYWGSGTVVAEQDRPEDPSILITPSNVVEGRISYGRVTPVEKRRSVSVVYWNDPEDGFRLTPEIVEDPDLIRRFGRRGDSADDAVTAFGVTNRGQAHRMALWGLEDEAPGSNSTAAYDVGDDHSFVGPGRIAAIADPMFTESRRGGRVRAATGSQMTLDAPVEIEAGQTYRLRVMLRNGSVSRRVVTNGPGTTATINLAGPDWPSPPMPGAVWSIETDQIANRQWRVRSITTDEPPFGVRAVLHDPTKWDRVELGRDISTPEFIDLPSGPLLPPTRIDAFEFLLRDGDAAIPSVQVSWTASTDSRITFYQAQFKAPGQGWEAFADSTDTSRTVRGVAIGQWSFRVRGLDSLGRKTRWVEGTFDLDGQVDSIPNVINLSLSSSDDAGVAALVWEQPDDRRPLRTEILYSLTTNIADAQSLGDVRTEFFVVPETGVYFVRNTFLGVTAENPPYIEVDSADLPAYLIREQLDAVTSDGQLTPREKSKAIIDYRGLIGDQSALDDRYQALGQPEDVEPFKIAADAAIDRLIAYLEALLPQSSWDDTSVVTPIPDPALYRDRWVEALDATSKYRSVLTARPVRDGESAYSIQFDNEMHTVPADPNGNVISYAGAEFTVSIFYGTQDVTESFSLDSTDNPQGLGYGGPFPAPEYPRYVINTGFDADELSARATYRFIGKDGTAHAGKRLIKVFSLAKSIAGDNGISPALISLSASALTARYDTAGNLIPGQAITFGAKRQNTNARTLFTLRNSAGQAVTAAYPPDQFAAAYGPQFWSAVDVDTMTLTEAGIMAVIRDHGGPTGRVTLIASIEGTGLTDAVSINKVQDGAKGADAETYTLTSSGARTIRPAGYLHGLRNADGQPFIDPNPEVGSSSDTYARSYTVCWRVSANVWRVRHFDVFGNGQITYPSDGFANGRPQGIDGMFNVLNAIPDGTPVIVYSSDEPNQNHTFPALLQAMYRCGASPEVFGKTFAYRGAYTLVGVAGWGQGRGFERVAGTIPHDPEGPTDALIQTTFQIVGGVPNSFTNGNNGVDGLPGVAGRNGITYYPYYAYANSPDGQIDFTTGEAGTRAYVGFGTGTSPTEPDSPIYYSWTAYKGPPFGLTSRNGVVVAGNQLIKQSGGYAWNADAYSTTGFRGGAAVAFRGTGDKGFMIGLNDDPNAGSSWEPLNYAWHPQSDGNASIYESGSYVGNFIVGYGLGLFQIIYDGNVIRYIYNGDVYREVPAPPNLTLYMDSSFLDEGARATDIEFTPVGAAAQSIQLSASSTTLRVGKDGNYFAGQRIDFNVQRTNMPGTTYFFLRNVDGNNIYAAPAAEYARQFPAQWGSSGPDNLYLTPQGAIDNMNAHGGAAGKFSMEAYVNGFTPVSRVTISKQQDGADGKNAIVAIADNETFTVPTDANGNYPAFPTDVSRGHLRVYEGLTEVTGQCTFTVQNPFYLDSYIDAAGAYFAIGLYNDTGYSDLVATYKGVAYTSRLTASKVKNGPRGTDGVNPPLISVAANPQAIRYDRDNNIISGDVVFTATLQNAMGPVSWRSLIGHGIYSTPGVSFSGNTMTISAARMRDVLAYNEANFGPATETIVASASGVSDMVTVTKIKDGSNGLAGAAGIGLIASPATFVIPSFANGTSKPTWAGGTCRIALNLGGQEIAADSYSYVAVSNVSSISISGQTISFTDIVGDRGEFTARATRAGVNYDLRITIVRANDGSAAFTSSTPFTGNFGAASGAANTTVPGGRTVRVSAYANYRAPNDQEGAGTLALYWRNLTDNGPLNFLGELGGSVASRYNQGSANDPIYNDIAGSVSTSYTFSSPSPDKSIEYSAAFRTTYGVLRLVDGRVAIDVIG